MNNEDFNSRRLDILYPDVAAEWDYEKNNGLKPSDVTSFSNKNVWWKCEKGHEWKTTINTRTANGTRCPYCSGRAALPGENDLATLYPEIAAMWHPTKNGSTTPDKVRTGSNKPYWWKCETGHEWKRTVYNSVMLGPVCPYCSGARVNPGINDLKTMYPQFAAQWHPTKNGSLKPEDVLPLSNRRVWWIDELGHEWNCEIRQRVTNLSGCPYCANKKVLKGFNDLATVCPEVAAQWHSSLNGALTPEMVTRGCRRRVWWQCSEGHVWKAIVFSRTKTKGTGCPVCAGKIRKNDNYNFVDEKILSLSSKPVGDKELELVVGGGDSSVREITAGKEEMQIHS